MGVCVFLRVNGLRIEAVRRGWVRDEWQALGFQFSPLILKIKPFIHTAATKSTITEESNTVRSWILVEIGQLCGDFKVFLRGECFGRFYKFGSFKEEVGSILF